MAQAAQEAWLDYRELLKRVLESRDVLGGPNAPGQPPLDEALDASGTLEDVCAGEKESGAEDEDRADEQLLAGATIDFLLAGELALLEAREESGQGADAAAEPPFERVLIWRDAVRLADRTFGLGEDDDDPRGGSLEPILPGAPGDVVAYGRERESVTERRPPPAVAGAAPGPNAEELRDNCFGTATNMIEYGSPSIGRAATFLAGPVGDMVGDLGLGLPDLPPSISDFAIRLQHEGRRSLRAVRHFVSKILRAMGVDPADTVPGLTLPEILSQIAEWIQERLVEGLVKTAADYPAFRESVLMAIDDFDTSDGAVRDARRANEELWRKYRRRVRFVRVMLRGASAVVHGLLAVTAPVIPATTMLVPMAFVLYQLRARFETLPWGTNGIPSVARKYAPLSSG